MVAYSLIDCSSDYFSVGIYTSLENLYDELEKVVIHECLDIGFSQEEIKTFYTIQEVHLDAKPLDCFEFSTSGTEIEINWDEVFKNY
jgi:hypothetical protein